MDTSANEKLIFNRRLFERGGFVHSFCSGSDVTSDYGWAGLYEEESQVN